MNGQEIAGAWLLWSASEEGRECLDGESNKFLRDRLWLAFIAGIKAQSGELADEFTKKGIL